MLDVHFGQTQTSHGMTPLFRKLTLEATPVITPSQSTSATPKRGTSPMKRDSSRSPMPFGASKPSLIVSSEDDLSVSDIGSDIEPEELLSAYLSTKTRLYNLRPDLVADSKNRGGKQAKQVKKAFEDDQPLTSGIIKLQKKLKQIEADVLFDPREADAQWTETRNKLAQEAASRRKYALGEDGLHQPKPSKKPATVNDLPGTIEQLVEDRGATINVDEEGDDDELLGAMFSAMSEDYSAPNVEDDTNAQSPSTTVSIRDFGKFVGVNPRRVLEEACRSRLVGPHYIEDGTS